NRLVGAGAGKADVRRDLVVGSVDRRERRFHLRRRVDAGDQRSVQLDAVARRRGRTLLLHEIVNLIQVLAQVVDRDAAHHVGVQLRLTFRYPAVGPLEAGDALAQNGDEVAHHVNDRVHDAEEVGVQVALGDAVANLPGEADVELVLRYRVQNRAVAVGGRRLQVHRHVDRLRGDGGFVHLLPGPAEVWAAGLDNAQLRIDVALFVFLIERGGYGIVERRRAADAHGPAKARLDGALVLVHRVNAREHISKGEPGQESEQDAGWQG